MDSVHIIILAAGQGSRLMPYTKDTPKCLVKVGGLPILNHQITALKKCNLKNITIVTGFMSEVIEEYARRTFPELNINFVLNNDYYKTNTLYSLFLASQKIDGETIFQLNGDVIFDYEIIENMINDTNKNLTALKFVKCGTEEIKCLIKDDRIIALNKSIDPNDAAGEAIGINKFSYDFWKKLSVLLGILKNDYSKSYFELAIEKNISDGEVFQAHNISGYSAIEIDFPEDLLTAEEMIKSKINRQKH